MLQEITSLLEKFIAVIQEDKMAFQKNCKENKSRISFIFPVIPVTSKTVIVLTRKQWAPIKGGINKISNNEKSCYKWV